MSLVAQREGSDTVVSNEHTKGETVSDITIQEEVVTPSLAGLTRKQIDALLAQNEAAVLTSLNIKGRAESLKKSEKRIAEIAKTLRKERLEYAKNRESFKQDLRTLQIENEVPVPVLVKETGLTALTIKSYAEDKVKKPTKKPKRSTNKAAEKIVVKIPQSAPHFGSSEAAISTGQGTGE